MLKYNETNWRCKEGLHTHNYQVTFYKIDSQTTIEEQKERAERLSLVNFIDDDVKDRLLEICSHFQKYDENFYFHKNKKFHVTMLGFPVIYSACNELVSEKIKQYADGLKSKIKIKFDLIRPGTKYKNSNTLKPVYGVSNGTIIAFGDSLHNLDFVTFGNRLASFLLKDENLISALGQKFRRRFPTVWCTMGYFTRDFMMTNEIELLFNGYRILDKDQFRIPCYDLELGTSCYKDLRDWKRVKRFSLS